MAGVRHALHACSTVGRCQCASRRLWFDPGDFSHGRPLRVPPGPFIAEYSACVTPLECIAYSSQPETQQPHGVRVCQTRCFTCQHWSCMDYS